MIRRFRTLGPADAPFELGPGRQVIDPGRVHASIEEDVAQGPEGPRARIGSLRKDLKDYLRARGI